MKIGIIGAGNMGAALGNFGHTLGITSSFLTRATKTSCVSLRSQQEQQQKLAPFRRR